MIYAINEIVSNLLDMQIKRQHLFISAVNVFFWYAKGPWENEKIKQKNITKIKQKWRKTINLWGSKYKNKKGV